MHRPHDAARAKYELKHTVRTHLGSDDEGHSAMGFGADLDGKQGMYMRKHVIEMAQKGLVENLKTLKPLMTPTTAKVYSQLCPGTPLRLADAHHATTNHESHSKLLG